jgi:hypothetical protein
VPRIRCMCPKILGHMLSHATLSKFSKPPSARPSIALDTAVPSSPAILNPGLRAHHCLIPSLKHAVVLDLAGAPLIDLGFPDSAIAAHLQPSMPPFACLTLTVPLLNLHFPTSLTPPPPPTHPTSAPALVTAACLLGCSPRHSSTRCRCRLLCL